MAQIRFKVQGGLAGSAARDAENEARAVPAREMCVRAGSAARDAEERKRVEISGITSAGFSLRARNGTVQRVEGLERVGGPVTPQGKTGLVVNSADSKASNLEGPAVIQPRVSASAETWDFSAMQTTPAAKVSSILRRLVPSFGKNS